MAEIFMLKVTLLMYVEYPKSITSLKFTTTQAL